MSIYHDLTIGSSPFREKTDVNKPISTIHGLQVAQVYVQPGDTVLSITEQLNHQIKELDISNIINDFKLLNPTTDPLNVQPFSSYFFPIYEVYH